MSSHDAADINIYRKQGWGQALGFGRSSALIVIDFTQGFADPAILGGGNIQSAIDHTVRVLAAARDAEIPIAFTRHVYAADGSDRGLFNLKAPILDSLIPDAPASQIVEQLRPQSGELRLDKRYPSAFFRTDFAGWLTVNGIDTLIITGCTTSGCIRATTVDCLCSGFRPVVVRDCCGDRASGPHEANLFDLQQKYADVLESGAVIDHLTNPKALAVPRLRRHS
jgi:maleamate amidohydrolase